MRMICPHRPGSLRCMVRGRGGNLIMAAGPNLPIRKVHGLRCALASLWSNPCLKLSSLARDRVSTSEWSLPWVGRCHPSPSCCRQLARPHSNHPKWTDGQDPNRRSRQPRSTGLSDLLLQKIPKILIKPNRSPIFGKVIYKSVHLLA